MDTDLYQIQKISNGYLVRTYDTKDVYRFVDNQKQALRVLAKHLLDRADTIVEEEEDNN